MGNLREHIFWKYIKAVFFFRDLSYDAIHKFLSKISPSVYLIDILSFSVP